MQRRRATAVSAIVLALGLTGAGATPFIVQSASASVTSYDPPVEPCDVGDPSCESDPQTTVTVTTTLSTPTPEGDPETTVTKTVTASPKKPTKTASPTTSSAPPPSPPQTTPTQNPQPVPSQNVEPPPTASATSEPPVEMPTAAPPTTSPPVVPTDTQSAASEEVPLELRNAAPEFDQRTLTQKLSIPALVLVLLALFAVLIFEGRLRRMAHAAAVRKAGPPLGGGRPDMPPGGYPPGGYPAGPGYAAGYPPPGHPGSTAYAPIISFVPVQTYPSGQVYQDVAHPYPPQGYAQEPPPPAAPSDPPPVVLHPDEFDSYSHEPPKAKEKEYRDLFEPLVPPTDIPPGGSGPLDDGREHPFGPASSAESGDSEPWEQGTSLFEPRRPAHDYEPPPYLPADEDVTAVQPLPRQEPTKEMPDSERERFRRSE
ncbi:hypothetical protein EDD27_7416 [Nonomuraea polychroma]|uniref:Uncharacterized protein n=1 Tax=Nonomuraea polychroma TaxID=46176 RepID=A0A438MGW0_9ACTN|nr:hypothetical protein [Nonomuraea polychroma]RVX44671.1 hypothetical protein EDD27_7416 [Nonomuraea polychroma]